MTSVNRGSVRQQALILVEPIEIVVQARGEPSGFGLTTRQEQVALHLVPGKGMKQIARSCGILENSAKDHVAGVYHRLDVHGREALLAKLTGIEGRG